MGHSESMSEDTGMLDENGAPITARVKGECSVCHKLLGLRKDGTLRGHGYNPGYDRGWCMGSHLPPHGAPPCKERCPGECGYDPHDPEDACAWAYINLGGRTVRQG